MKIGIVNFAPLKYNVDTPYQKPLGGSESGICYLTAELAKRGHRTTLFGHMPGTFTLRGVKHEPASDTIDKGKDLDFLVIQNTPFFGQQIRADLSNKTKLIFWSGHATDQKVVHFLKDPEFRNVFDGYAFVSHWQMEAYIRDFDLERKKCAVLGNAISPGFENLYPKGERILKVKTQPPVLVYSTTPFRGLNILIDIFPQIQQIFPKVRLKIFSSLRVYQGSKKDEEPFQKLYELCRNTEGVDYSPSIAQSLLAKQLPKVSILTYPSTCIETSCITAMEAMAAGCQVITSDLAALSETTAGFAKLVPVTIPVKDYKRVFIEETVEMIKKFMENDQELERNLAKQIAFVNRNYTWEKRAQEWEMWLKQMAK